MHGQYIHSISANPREEVIRDGRIGMSERRAYSISESISMSIASAACRTQLSSCASFEALCIVDSICFANSIRSFSLSRIEKSVGNDGRSTPEYCPSISQQSTASQSMQEEEHLTFPKRSHQQSLHLLLLRRNQLDSQSFSTSSRRSSRSMDVDIS